MAVQPLSPATDRCQGGPLPRHLANQTRAHLRAHKALIPGRCLPGILCGISSRFQLLSPTPRQVAHALLTRSPLSIRFIQPKPKSTNAPFDLHVLGTPPAFVLSQDQTLNDWYYITRRCYNQSQDLSSKYSRNYVGFTDFHLRVQLCFWIFSNPRQGVSHVSRCLIYKVHSASRISRSRALARQPDYYSTSFFVCQELFSRFRKNIGTLWPGGPSPSSAPILYALFPVLSTGFVTFVYSPIYSSTPCVSFAPLTTIYSRFHKLHYHNVPFCC